MMIARRDKLRSVERELLAAARQALVTARSQPGYDPTIIDQVMSEVDVRSAALGT